MDPQKSSMIVGQPLLPMQEPPEYSNVDPSESYPRTSGQPVQQYGAPAASGQCIQEPYPVQPVQQYGAPAASGQCIQEPYPVQSVQQYGAPAASGLCTQGPYPGQSVVTVQPPVNVSFTPLAKPVPDYLCYSIFTMLCCCLPLGSAALVYSITTRDANTFGHQPIASRNSRMARILNHVSVAIGGLLWLIIVIYVIVVIAVTNIRYNHNYGRYGP